MSFVRTVLICNLLLFIGLPFTPTLSAESHLFSARQSIMGTWIEVRIIHSDKGKAEDAIDKVFRVFSYVDALMSTYRPDSEVSNVNSHAGIQPVRVGKPLMEVVRAAIQVSEASDGAFDISWAALWGVWKFHPGAELPDKTLIASRIHLIGYKDILLNNTMGEIFLKRKGMKIDLGGIAKGYALKLASETLRKLGVVDFLIDAGGDIYAHGTRNGSPWQIGIKHPRKPGAYFATISITDQAIVTSGDYERFFMKDGVRYHHIINPQTGYPAWGCVSVTVVMKDPMLADALATAAFVLGPEKGISFLEKWEGADGLIVDGTGNIYMTDGIKEKIHLAEHQLQVSP